MNRLKKISIIGAVGGAFIGQYFWLNESSQVWAATNEETQAASLAPIISLILDDNDLGFNTVPDAQTTDEDTPLDFNALNNNLISVEGSNIVSTEVSVNNGLLTISVNAGLITQGTLNTSAFTISGTTQQINDALATLNYDPNLDFNGIDVLTITTTDSNGASDIDTVQIVVNPTDDGAPDAIDDDFSTPFNADLSANVLSNDTLIDEADVDPVSNAATSLGGSVSIAADGSFTYTPPNGFASTDTFVYTLRDADNQTDTATINIEPITFDVIIPDNNGPAVSGNESAVEGQAFTNGSFTVVAAAGLATTGFALIIDHESGDQLALTLAQLNDLATENQPLGTMAGQIVLTNYASGTGVVNYQYNAVVSDHSGGDFSVDDSFTITAVDVNSVSSTPATLDFLINDTNPVANNDARMMFEGSSAIAGNAVGIAGSATGDIADTIVDPATVTDLDFEGVDGTVGTSLAGEIGTLVIDSAGVYTYTLDNTNPAVQGLKAGESEVDVFTYTLTDNEAPSADSDTATIAITVNGVEDAAPTITIPDVNGGVVTGDQSVSEASSSTINGTITVNASAGIDELTIDNQDLTNATASNITVNGSEGTLVVSSFNPSTGVINYSFTEDGNNESHNANDDNVVDSFTISLLDNEGDSASDTLDILITDTAPTAASNSNTITEDQGFPVTGDVLTNDTSGADTAISVFAIDFDGNTQTVGQPFDTEFGTLDLNADGTYTYTLDNANSAVQALNFGQSVEEVFTYTIADTDGDQSSTGLFITINGADE